MPTPAARTHLFGNSIIRKMTRLTPLTETLLGQSHNGPTYRRAPDRGRVNRRNEITLGPIGEAWLAGVC